MIPLSQPPRTCDPDFGLSKDDYEHLTGLTKDIEVHIRNSHLPLPLTSKDDSDPVWRSTLRAAWLTGPSI